jgi:hypothetical protein
MEKGKTITVSQMLAPSVKILSGNFTPIGKDVKPKK